MKNYRSVSKKNNSLFYKSWRNNFLSVIFGREEKKISNLDKNKIIKMKKFSKEICKFIKIQIVKIIYCLFQRHLLIF